MKRFIIAGMALLGSLAAMGSTSASASPAVARNAIYSYGAGTLQTVTVYSPKVANGASVVLIHGGGFRSSAGDALHLAIEAITLVAYGDSVFVVNYRNDRGGVGIADQVADVVSGSDWVLANAASFGANPSALTMIGGSSGGLIAADAAELLNTASNGTVKTVITLSGPMDFGSIFSYWLPQGSPLAQLHRTDLSTVLGCTLTRHKHVRTYTCPTALEDQYSPDQQITSANCPNSWIIFNGLSEEQPTSQATAMDDALAAAGCTHSLNLFAGSAHAFDYWSVVKGQIQAAIAVA